MSYRVISIIPLTNTLELLNLETDSILYWKLPACSAVSAYKVGEVINIGV